MSAVSANVEPAEPCEVDDCDNPATPCECGAAHCDDHPHGSDACDYCGQVPCRCDYEYERHRERQLFGD